MKALFARLFAALGAVKSLSVVITVVVGVMIATALYFYERADVESNAKKAFNTVAEVRGLAVQSELHINIDVGKPVHSFFNTSKSIKRDEFRTFIRGTLELHEAVRWMAWAPQSNNTDREAMELGKYHETLPGFQITQLNKEGRASRAQQADSYFPIFYLESLKTDSSMSSFMGVDLAADKDWKAVMDKSRDQGDSEVAAAGLNNPAFGSKATILVFEPIYKNGMAQGSAEEKRAAFLGFVVALVDTQKMTGVGLKKGAPSGGGAHLSLQLDLGESSKTELYLHESRTKAKSDKPLDPAVAEKFKYTHVFKDGDHEWALVATPSAKFIEDHASLLPLITAAVAFLISALVGVFFHVQGRAARAKEAVAAQKAKENEALNDSIIEILRSVSKLSQGDLRVQAPVREDVTGALSDAINSMTDSTAKALAGVNASSEAVRAESKIGRETVLSTAKGMNEVRGTIQETGKRIKRLGERSQEITGIVKLIDDIAERTSVLALNANMQAAVAGEAGRGFRVVADEVQRLAERSKEATDQIGKLVSTIQGETNDTIATMEKAIGEVVKGGELAEKAAAQVSNLEKLGNELHASVQIFTLTDEAHAVAAAARRAA